MNSEQLRKIKSYAKNQMAKLGLHGWPHIERVERLCILISKREVGKNGVNLDALKVAALLHDIAKHVEKKDNLKDHGDVGAIIAQGFLKTNGFSETETSLICHAIRAHTHQEEPLSVEAKILHDADFLDKLGAVGIASVFIKACLTKKTIEEVSEMYESEPPEPSYVGKHIRWLKRQHFYTNTAKKIAEQRNKIVPVFFKALKSELDLKAS